MMGGKMDGWIAAKDSIPPPDKIVEVCTVLDSFPLPRKAKTFCWPNIKYWRPVNKGCMNPNTANRKDR